MPAIGIRLSLRKEVLERCHIQKFPPLQLPYVIANIFDAKCPLVPRVIVLATPICLLRVKKLDPLSGAKFARK